MRVRPLFCVITLVMATGVEAELDRTVVPLDIPTITSDEDSAGGIVVADLNGDERPDFLVSVRGHIAAYANNGDKLWIAKVDLVVGSSSESHGLPGHHGPGVAAGDVDGDGRCEVIYLTRDGTLHIVDGATGKERSNAKPPVPKGAQDWELAMIADFRGQGDRDLLLQATNAEGYRMGRYVAAFVTGGLRPLWQTDQFVSCAHNGARLADLDGDGRDEVLGATLFSHDGKLISQTADFHGHMDSVFVADVQPDRPGLEVVLLEEGSNHVQLLGMGGPIWRKHFKRQEAQNAAIGRFDPDSRSVQIWCRSRYNEHQKPFVFDSRGEMVFTYAMDDVAPPDWTVSGVEVIHTIDWTGGRTQIACAKERHRSGDVALFEPLTGKFVLRIPEKADRLYVADVFGDWREEITILSGNELHIYANPAPNPRPDQPRRWLDRNYRGLKQCHNYYSP